MGWIIGFSAFVAVLIYIFGFFYGARIWRSCYIHEQQKRNEKEKEVMQLKRAVMALEDKVVAQQKELAGIDKAA